MKGWRTFAFGLAAAVIPSALTYMAHVDWTRLVDPNYAMLITGAVTMALRAITTTPPGRAR